MKFTKAFLLFLLCLASLAAAAQAGEPATPSLFFSPQTIKHIDALARGEKTNGDAAQRSLRLDSLLYSGPDNWTFWLNGETWRPGTDRPPVHVMAVTADGVRLSLDGARGKPQKEIVLHPSQSVSLTSEK